MVSASSSRRTRCRIQFTFGSGSGIATTVSGTCSAFISTAPASQLPKWPVTRMAPRPSASASLNKSARSYEKRSSTFARDHESDRMKSIQSSV